MLKQSFTGIIILFTKITLKNLKNNSITEYFHFQNIFLEILHKHAPIKKKILRFNDNPFMTKAQRKAIMHRSKLKKTFSIKQELRKIGTTTKTE